jgi:hypothetical protein
VNVCFFANFFRSFVHSSVSNNNTPRLALYVRFTFTQLDAGDPARSFSFVLNVNDEDTYEVEDPFPPLDSIILHELVEKLNETDDLSVFCRGMRKYCIIFWCVCFVR